MKLKSTQFSEEKERTRDEKCPNSAIKLAQSVAKAHLCRPAQLATMPVWVPGVQPTLWMIWVLGCVVVTALLGLFSLQWPGAEVAPVLDALWPFGHVLEFLTGVTWGVGQKQTQYLALAWRAQVSCWLLAVFQTSFPQILMRKA